MDEDNSIFENDDDGEGDFVELPRNLPYSQREPSPPPPSPPVRATPGARPITPPFQGATVLQFPGRGGIGETDQEKAKAEAEAKAAADQAQAAAILAAQQNLVNNQATNPNAESAVYQQPVPASPIWPIVAGIALVVGSLWVHSRMRSQIADLAEEYEG
jgi:hypothetical protein